MITVPTTLSGERVVCVFPVIGGEAHTDFVEADVVTTNDAEPQVFAVRRYQPHRAVETGLGSATTSFPDAIRHARKNAGWG